MKSFMVFVMYAVCFCAASAMAYKASTHYDFMSALCGYLFGIVVTMFYMVASELSQ